METWQKLTQKKRAMLLLSISLVSLLYSFAVGYLTNKKKSDALTQYLIGKFAVFICSWLFDKQEKSNALTQYLTIEIRTMV